MHPSNIATNQQDEGNIREILRTSTREDHTAIDSHRLSAVIMQENIGLDDYKAFLSLQWGFISPIEELLLSSPRKNWLEEAGLPIISRSADLRKDLIALGIGTERLKTMERLPIHSTPGNTVGITYVLTGSAMGGLLIWKQVSQRLGIDAAQSGRFLTGGGDPKLVAKNLHGFFQALDTYQFTEETKTDAVIGARDTFRAIHEWFDRFAWDSLAI